MKRIKISVISVAVLVIVLTYSIGAAAKGEGGTPGTGKYKNLFMFKADKNFVGAKVDVLNHNGALLTTQTLEKKKMIIDFTDMKEGLYTIRVSKGDRISEYQYERK